jgi:hypothetical protein
LKKTLSWIAAVVAPGPRKNPAKDRWEIGFDGMIIDPPAGARPIQTSKAP